MDEDDMIVVIVGDDYPEQEHGSIQIKQEIEDIDESYEIGDSVEDMIATVKKHGQVIPIKEELALDYEELGDFTDDDYIPEEGEILDEDENDEHPLIHKRVRRNRKRKSFIKELITSNPELKDDSQLLIWTLVRMMWDTKRPNPPDFSFVYNEDNNNYECNVCSATSETCPAAERHYQEKHGPRYLICYACGVDFRSTTNLYKHEKACSAPDAEIMLRARALSLGRKGKSRPFIPKDNEVIIIKSVRAKQASERRFACDQCSAKFISKNSLLSHQRHHAGLRLYRCTECVAAYTSSSGLARHMKRHSNEQFICDTCGRSFKIKTALITHLDTHLPLRKFECTMCGRRYAQKMALKLHVDRKHLNLPPPCPCTLCPKRYPRMSVLKTHMMKEHGMVLMTRNMFFKKLPTLTNDQVEQAKVVLSSDANMFLGDASVAGDSMAGFLNINNQYNEEERDPETEEFDNTNDVYENPEFEQETGEEIEENREIEHDVNLTQGDIEESSEYHLTQEDIEANEKLAKEFYMLLKSGDGNIIEDEDTKVIVVENGEIVSEERGVFNDEVKDDTVVRQSGRLKRKTTKMEDSVNASKIKVKKISEPKILTRRRR